MDKRKLWSIIKTCLKIAVTVLSMYLVFRKVNPKDLREAFLQSNPWYFLLAWVCFVGSQFISASRLNTYFREIGLWLSGWYNLWLYLLGMFYNIFLPGGIGGDGYKVYFLRRQFGVKGRSLLAAVFFDRLSGFWALFFLIASLVIFIPDIGIPNAYPIAAMAVATFIYYGLVRHFFKEYAQNFIIKHLKAIGVQSLQVLAAVFILYGLHFNGKFSPYLFVFLGSSLAALFPFTIGGLGAREVIIVYGSTWFGLDAHLAVLISITFYVITASVSLCGAYFVFNPRPLGIIKLPDREGDQ